MHKWQKDFLELLHALVDEVENFFVDMNEIVDAFLEFTQDFGEPIETTEPSEISDLEIGSFLGDVSENYWHTEESFLDFDPAFPYAVEPTPEKNPACIGCRYYHGYAYGGNLLVCAMHPQGWHDSNCPDWEAEDVFE